MEKEIKKNTHRQEEKTWLRDDIQALNHRLREMQSRNKIKNVEIGYIK
jgi:hypothetical protein